MLTKLQAKWRALNDRVRQMTCQLSYKYGSPWYVHAPWGQREKVDAMNKREDAAMEAVFAWLDDNSPRSWRVEVPAYWVCSELTLADALTTGQLSVVPPPGYGSFPCDSVRFALPLAG